MLRFDHPRVGHHGQDSRALYVRSDGNQVRPSLVILDDPQTDESARSPLQTSERLEIINGAIRGLAGPNHRTAIIIPCTVIRAGDLADKLLDRQTNPHWHGERTKMVYQFPGNAKLWSDYAKIRQESLRADGDGREATEFYRQHRAEMDDGAVVAWPQRFDPDEISAIQHAMNLRFTNEQSFFAEYQNEPMASELAEEEQLTATQVAERTNGRERGEIPTRAAHLTAFVDVHDKLLYYMVSRGSRTSPATSSITASILTSTAGISACATPGPRWGGCIRAWARGGDPGGPQNPHRDAAGPRVEQGRRHGHADRAWPGGQRLRPGDGLLRHPAQRAGGHDHAVKGRRHRPGREALLQLHPQGGRAVWPPLADTFHQGHAQLPTVSIDTNFWKTFVADRLATGMGDGGSLSLFEAPGQDHQLLSEHLTSEYRIRTQGRNRVVDVWKGRVNVVDNHWFDCLVGCAVAASMFGASLPGMSHPADDRKPLKLSSLIRR